MGDASGFPSQRAWNLHRGIGGVRQQGGEIDKREVLLLREIGKEEKQDIFSPLPLPLLSSHFFFYIPKETCPVLRAAVPCSWLLHSSHPYSATAMLPVPAGTTGCHAHTSRSHTVPPQYIQECMRKGEINPYANCIPSSRAIL